MLSVAQVKKKQSVGLSLGARFVGGVCGWANRAEADGGGESRA
jgi:hypothetical protein